MAAMYNDEQAGKVGDFGGGRMRLGRCCKEWCAMYSTYEYT